MTIVAIIYVACKKMVLQNHNKLFYLNFYFDILIDMTREVEI